MRHDRAAPYQRRARSAPGRMARNALPRRSAGLASARCAWVQQSSALALLAAMAAAGPAQAAPSAAFDLRTPRPCVAGDVPRPADLRHRRPGQRGEGRGRLGHPQLARRLPARRRARLLLRPCPEDLGYEPIPCEASSPAFQQPGTAQVAVRVTDTVDGTQATATRPVVVAAPPGAQGHGARPARLDARPVRPPPARRAVRPRQRPQDRRRRRQGARTTAGPR